MASQIEWNAWVGFRRELRLLLDDYTQCPTQERLDHLTAELQLFLKNHLEGFGMPAVLRPKMNAE